MATTAPVQRPLREPATKIHARVDRQGRPIQLLITPGQAHDLTGAKPLLASIDRGAIIIADKPAVPFRMPAGIKLAKGSALDIPGA